ncbi:hypothetical protein BSKO_01699 [Bryopsis sp. KO-2023]|nr:hypothetical protein BSKO_01699 [Bryopsis sp. KO-2023]
MEPTDRELAPGVTDDKEGPPATEESALPAIPRELVAQPAPLPRYETVEVQRSQLLLMQPKMEEAGFSDVGTVTGGAGMEAAQATDAAGKRGRKGQDGEGVSKKRARKPPDSPRRPKSAYMFFLAEFRERWKIEHPESRKVSDVAKAAGERWRAMSEEDKRPFEDLSTESKALYAREMEVYRSTKKDVPKPPRRAKREKDPPQEAPQNAYEFFFRDFQEAYKNEHPEDQPQTKTMKKLASDKWKSMTPEEKVPYEDLAKESREEQKLRLKSVMEEQMSTAEASLLLGQAGVPSVGPSPRSRPFGVIPSVGPTGDLIYPEPVSEPMDVQLTPSVPASVLLHQSPIEVQVGPPASTGHVGDDLLSGAAHELTLPSTVYVIRTSEQPRIKDEDLEDDQPPP